MNTATRWRKLFRDFDAIQGRVLMTIAAIAVGIFAVTIIASAYAILTREVSRNYVDTNPASALIDLGEVLPEHIELAQNKPDISAVEATSIIAAKVERAPDEWLQILLFAVPDFDNMRINTVFPQEGKFPPETGTILLEREALIFLGREIGDTIRVQTPDGPKVPVSIAGTVHDPSLPPAWQQQTAYGYLTPETLAMLGGNPAFEILKVAVKDATFDQQRVDAVTLALANEFRTEGYEVHQMQVPPTGRHPHQGQMSAVLSMFGIFAVLALILSAILTASMIDGLLAQQVRQIAVMKTVGASSRQIAGLYLVAILAISATAAALAIPLGILGGRSFADIIAQLLNFDIASYSLQFELILGLVALGLLVPGVFALAPITRAARATVREALSDYGVTRKEFGGDWLSSALAKLSGIDRTLLLAIRNAFRRRGRLILSLTLLGTAGGMFIASLSVQNAWNYATNLSAEGRDYDIDLRLTQPVRTDKLLELIASTPGVAKVEPWGHAYAARAREDGLTLLRTYPDGGHAALEYRSMPAPDRLSHFPLLDGTMPRVGEMGDILINQGARRLLGSPHAGDLIDLTVDGRVATHRLAGVIRQYVTPPAIYVSPPRFQEITEMTDTTNAVRVFAETRAPEAIEQAVTAIEARLEVAGIAIQISMSENQFGEAIEGHVKILIVSLIGMSILMAIVGILGLASAQGSNVAERTREFGIMRTIGGTRSVIIRNIIAEGLFSGLLSLVGAILLALPLAAAIGDLVGNMSFAMALPLVLSTQSLWIWIAIIIVGTTVASLVPAVSASRLTVRETLSHA